MTFMIESIACDQKYYCLITLGTKTSNILIIGDNENAIFEYD